MSKHQNQIQAQKSDPDNSSVSIKYAYQGPIPDPQMLQRYESVLPGSAERILAMAEESQRQNGYAIKAGVEHEGRIHTTARWSVWIALSGGFVLAILNRDLPSYGVLITALAGLIGSFVYSKKSDRKTDN